MTRRIVVLVFALCLSVDLSNHLFAQDPIFSQFYGNPLYLNPALTGADRCPRVVLNYRNQWPGLDNTVYLTYSASYDQHVKALAGGIGLLAFQDIAGQGSLTTTNISGIYNKHIQVTREFIVKLAVQGTWFQKKVDYNKLHFGDMIDRRSGFIYTTQEVKQGPTQGWDFSAGAFAYTKNYYGGVAVKHINQPNEGFVVNSKLPIRITAHAGAMIPIGDKKNEVSISPNVLYQQQGNFHELNIGLYLKKSAIVSGLWYRSGDAIIILLGIQQPHFKVGYSYDVTVSKLTNATWGSHELSFALLFPCKEKVKKFTPVNCPSF